MRNAFRVFADVCATQDQHDRFYADHNKMSEFEEEKHKKYEAETYFQVCARPLSLPARGGGPAGPAPTTRARAQRHARRRWCRMPYTQRASLHPSGRYGLCTTAACHAV